MVLKGKELGFGGQSISCDKINEKSIEFMWEENLISLKKKKFGL